MGISVGGSKRGTFMEMNVVPLIDILLVLLVIFMVIPNSRGMKVQIPQQSPDPQPRPNLDVLVIQVLADGTLKLNQQNSVANGIAQTAAGDLQVSRRPRSFRSWRESGGVPSRCPGH